MLLVDFAGLGSLAARIAPGAAYAQQVNLRKSIIGNYYPVLISGGLLVSERGMRDRTLKGVVAGVHHDSTSRGGPGKAPGMQALLRLPPQHPGLSPRLSLHTSNSLTVPLRVHMLC